MDAICGWRRVDPGRPGETRTGTTSGCADVRLGIDAGSGRRAAGGIDEVDTGVAADMGSGRNSGAGVQGTQRARGAAGPAAATSAGTQITDGYGHPLLHRVRALAPALGPPLP